MSTGPDTFNRLTVDGITRRGPEMLRWADELVERHGSASWALDLRATLARLMADGSIDVRTSGTTGAPRAFRSGIQDILASIALTRDAFGLVEGDRALLCVPSGFVAGKMMLARAMVLGLDLHVIDPQGGVLNNLRTTDRFRFAAMIPLQLHTALMHDRARIDEQFDTILLGGGPVSDGLVAMLRGMRTRIVLGYASTETLTHVALRPLNGPDASDVYTAQRDVTFASGGQGCLVVRTPHLSVKEHVTNDAVEVLDERHMRWLGRLDHVILSGGRKIHPERLEATTEGIIPIPHFFAALPDERLGQAVVLVLETGAPGSAPSMELMERINAALHEHDRPRRVITLRSFIRTGTGKVDRNSTLALAVG